MSSLPIVSESLRGSNAPHYGLRGFVPIENHYWQRRASAAENMLRSLLGEVEARRADSSSNPIYQQLSRMICSLDSQPRPEVPWKRPLEGKVAIVTGGSRGIGAAIARRLATNGASVAITFANSLDKANAVKSEIEAAGCGALALQADSGDPASVKSAIAAVVTKFGRLDILVNNVGVSVGGGPIASASIEDFDRMIAVNVKGVFIATQEALNHMQAGGRIINIGSSMSVHSPFAGASVYTLTKSAIAGFTRGLVRDLGPRNITINNVQPGPVDTDMNPANGPAGEFICKSIAVKRFGAGEDIASVVAFLASPEASYVTGANLLVDGGFTA